MARSIAADAYDLQVTAFLAKEPRDNWATPRPSSSPLPSVPSAPPIGFIPFHVLQQVHSYLRALEPGPLGAQAASHRFMRVGRAFRHAYLESDAAHERVIETAKQAALLNHSLHQLSATCKVNSLQIDYSPGSDADQATLALLISACQSNLESIAWTTIVNDVDPVSGVLDALAGCSKLKRFTASRTYLELYDVDVLR